MENSAGKSRIFWATLSGVVCLGLLWGSIVFFVRSSSEEWAEDERARISEVLVSLRSSIESELYSRIYYTKSVAAYVSLHPEAGEEEFQNLASELIGSDPVINTMGLAPDAVIASLYPLEGHEEAIGLDLLDHPERRKIVEQTIRTGKTYVAGPVELVEGGIAFISYTPIFDKTTAPPWDFWGTTDIVIRKDEFFRTAGLDSVEQGVRVALRGVDGTGRDGEVFFGDPEVFAQDPVSVTVQLPDGEWILAGFPETGWSGYWKENRIVLAIMVCASTAIALLIGFLTTAVFQLMESRERLEELNNDKNQLLSIIAHDMRSPLSAVERLSSELLDSRGPELTSDRRELAELIHQSSEESLFLLENLLDWVQSREKGGLAEPKIVDLADLCDSVCGSFMAATRSKGVRFENRVPAGTMVYVDPRILGTVFRNLISNAVKYSNEKGIVSIGISEPSHSSLEVYVQDSGVGMSASRVEEILAENTSRSSFGGSSEKGAGIGMILCRELLRRSLQSMRIKSQKGEGTTVYFTLATAPDGIGTLPRK